MLQFAVVRRLILANPAKGVPLLQAAQNWRGQMALATPISIARRRMPLAQPAPGMPPTLQ
jgi:hypothetical protein